MSISPSGGDHDDSSGYTTPLGSGMDMAIVALVFAIITTLVLGISCWGVKNSCRQETATLMTSCVDEMAAAIASCRKKISGTSRLEPTVGTQQEVW